MSATRPGALASPANMPQGTEHLIPTPPDPNAKPMRPAKHAFKFYLWLVCCLLLIALLLVVAGLAIGYAIKYVPWLALPLFLAGFLWAAPTLRAQTKLLNQFKRRGMTIDDFGPVRLAERNRLGAPKNARIVRYHDKEAVEYWALAITRGWQFEILRDVPRQVYESEKPAWKEGDDIDLEALKEIANPSAARKYMMNLMLSMHASEGGTMILDETADLPDVADAAKPKSFASLLQTVQIMCHTAQTNGSAPTVVHGQVGYAFGFTCLGEPGKRKLALTLVPDVAGGSAT